VMEIVRTWEEVDGLGEMMGLLTRCSDGGNGESPPRG
jgi:hypothetical protein